MLRNFMFVATSNSKPLEAFYSWEKTNAKLLIQNSIETLSEVLDISIAAAWLASDLLKVLAILSDTQDLQLISKT